MNKKTIKDVDVKGKKVFVRVDYNVPFDANMNITNDTRMVRTLPTLNYLLDNGAALIIACHIGRPTEAREDKFSTKHLVKHLSELLKRDVKWASDCVGTEAEKAAKDLKPGEVLLLENLRYHKEEKKNDPTFAKQLASLADVAVDDAFGVSHRAHASNAGIPKYIETVAGFLMEKEINYIGKALEAPQHPFVAIIGGAKYYGDNYLKSGQDTFYLKKFNVTEKGRYEHQYMTNVQAAAEEGRKLGEAYTEDLKQKKHTFRIPVYQDMPESAAAQPN